MKLIGTFPPPPQTAAYGLDAGSNEGVSCDNESLHSEFITLISSTSSSDGIGLEKFNSQYVVHTYILSLWMQYILAWFHCVGSWSIDLSADLVGRLQNHFIYRNSKYIPGLWYTHVGKCSYMYVHVHVHVACCLCTTIIYSSKRSQRSDNDETGSDIDLFLLSQDIESAIERFLPSSLPDNGHSTIPNDAQLAKEEFLPAKLNEWCGTCSNDEGTCTCTCMLDL